MRLTVSCLLLSALVAGFVPPVAAEAAHGPHLAEAGVLLFFGEHLGAEPLVSAGAELELGVGSMLGLSVGGGVGIASRRAYDFFSTTEVGGGLSAAIRLYLRGRFPAGFGLGAGASLLTLRGVATFLPRVEVFYRWILGPGLTFRITGSGGGLFLWDTQPDDANPGPSSGSVSGALMAIGLSVGWARGLTRASHQPSAASRETAAPSRPSRYAAPRRAASTPWGHSRPRSTNLQRSHGSRYDVGEKTGLTAPSPSD